MMAGTGLIIEISLSSDGIGSNSSYLSFSHSVDTGLLMMSGSSLDTYRSLPGVL